MRIRCIIYIRACIAHALVHVYYGILYKGILYTGIITMSAAMACVFCHKPSCAGQRCVLYPESFKNNEQRGFFAKFVSPGYKWPEGLDTLYF